MLQVSADRIVAAMGFLFDVSTRLNLHHDYLARRYQLSGMLCWNAEPACYSPNAAAARSTF
jgi:hypothetical protein